MLNAWESDYDHFRTPAPELGQAYLLFVCLGFYWQSAKPIYYDCL
jgi:hypothetical protein